MPITRRTSSVTETLDVMGDYWMLRLLGRFFIGASAWGDFADGLGVSPTTLSKRLTQLMEAGCVTKTTAAGGARYQLTPKGLELFPIIASLDEWRLRWDDADGAGRSPWTHDCGAPLRCKSLCACCGLDVRLSDVTHIVTEHAREARPARPRHFRNVQATVVSREGGIEAPSRVLQVMGDRRASIVVAALNRGLGRFDEILEFTGLHPATLSERLRKLQLLDLANERLYQEAPDRYFYGLSDAARDIFPTTMQQMQWGDRWIFGDGHEPVHIVHNPCGKRLRSELRCKGCDREVHLHDLKVSAPGLEPLIPAPIPDAAQRPNPEHSAQGARPDPRLRPH